MRNLRYMAIVGMLVLLLLGSCKSGDKTQATKKFSPTANKPAEGRTLSQEKEKTTSAKTTKKATSAKTTKAPTAKKTNKRSSKNALAAKLSSDKEPSPEQGKKTVQEKQRTVAKSRQAELLRDGREIAKRTERRPGYVSSEATALEMKLINARGKERRREFIRYQFKTATGKRTLMKFLYPPDIKNTGTLNQEVWGENDIQHLYLPAAKKLRRITTKNKSQSWVGSDFTFEDLQEIEFDDYQYTFLGMEQIDGHDCYKYSMVPVSPDKSIYSKQYRWVRTKGFLPVKWEYYDMKGRVLKTLHAFDFRKVNGIDYAWKIVAKNVQDNHTTDLTRRWAKLDTGMKEEVVSRRQLKKSIDLYNHPRGLQEMWKATLPK